MSAIITATWFDSDDVPHVVAGETEGRGDWSFVSLDGEDVRARDLPDAALDALNDAAMAHFRREAEDRWERDAARADALYDCMRDAEIEP